MWTILNNSNPSNQRGDTIVEVLIAIAVVSLVLGGAYVTTNRSLQATRSAQERSIALKLAESQVERLKGIITSSPAQIFGGSAPASFCISLAGAVVSTVTAPANAACNVNNTGVATTKEPVFHLAVVRNANTFKVTETWYDVSGKNTDKLVVSYRVYQ
jgi:prepilin-type N-terminal cleavage/methylation domain-containing protein